MRVTISHAPLLSNYWAYLTLAVVMLNSVSMGAEKAVKVIYADDDSIRMHCVKSDKYVSAQLYHDSLDARDEWFSTWSPTCVIGSASRVVIPLPNKYEEEKVTGNNAVIFKMPRKAIAKRVGITPQELAAVYSVARQTFIAAQREKNRSRHSARRGLG